ncbi:MAG: alpha/beta hydrolase [Bacteroidetes bacterium]|nr:alpha/beta hydrolase [Bacteroidota bacterium]MBK7138217.1 alpha/beta hydrolase [Bacteroidota bacterium]MBK9354342.1 alpha/beta hydrolase [Bacteroidota bacterium]
MFENASDISNSRLDENVSADENKSNNALELSPVRDYYRMDEAIMKEYVANMAAQEDPDDDFIAPCGGITPQTSTVKDFFGNRIRAIAQYGPDPRNIYYIQYNTITNQPNKPIVILIHGGAWFSGPNPNTTKGWFFGWTASNSPSTNIVKQLLANGYVVVTPLYPLISYGKDNAEILLNPTTIQTQLDNIDLAIGHIRANFPTCLGLNANSIQLIGESAGGHLALNWAYNSANTSFIKSVISCYAPTNMQQYGEYIRVKPNLFTCGTNFVLSPLPNPHFPWYIHMNLSSNLVTYNTYSSPLCTISNTITNNPNPRILDLFNIIQSSYTQILTLPLSNNNTLLNYSPYNALNVNSIIVPTFIMHGDNDNLVPYSNATNLMSNALDNNGGLIFNYAISGTGTSIPASSAYSSLADKHGIKIYTNGDHGFTNGPLTLIRGDMIKWLNGHK